MALKFIIIVFYKHILIQQQAEHFKNHIQKIASTFKKKIFNVEYALSNSKENNISLNYESTNSA